MYMVWPSAARRGDFARVEQSYTAAAIVNLLPFYTSRGIVLLIFNRRAHVPAGR